MVLAERKQEKLQQLFPRSRLLILSSQWVRRISRVQAAEWDSILAPLVIKGLPSCTRVFDEICSYVLENQLRWKAPERRVITWERARALVRDSKHLRDANRRHRLPRGTNPSQETSCIRQRRPRHWHPRKDLVELSKDTVLLVDPRRNGPRSALRRRFKRSSSFRPSRRGKTRLLPRPLGDCSSAFGESICWYLPMSPLQRNKSAVNRKTWGRWRYSMKRHGTELGWTRLRQRWKWTSSGSCGDGKSLALFFLLFASRRRYQFFHQSDPRRTLSCPLLIFPSYFGPDNAPRFAATLVWSIRSSSWQLDLLLPHDICSYHEIMDNKPWNIETLSSMDSEWDRWIWRRQIGRNHSFSRLFHIYLVLS